MHISKRSLGEGYIVGTGTVLALVLVGHALQSEAGTALWTVVWCIPALVLVGAIVWLHRLELSTEQVWNVATFSALGLGIGTMVLLSIEVLSPPTPPSTAESVLFGTTLTTMGVAGAFAGLVGSVQHSNRELQRRNAVLDRVLRHNLRNDMTVVKCMLDDIDASSNGAHCESIQQARDTIDSLVRLTDKVRQASMLEGERPHPPQPRDVTSLVEKRVVTLGEAHPTVDIETSMPDHALAYVDETFGFVVDNVVESALAHGSCPPEMEIRVRVDGSDVSLCIDDCGQTLPEADLSAVAAGAETALEHGHGVELWLVDWLVETNGGELTFDTVGERHRLQITVERATGSLL